MHKAHRSLKAGHTNSFRPTGTMFKDVEVEIVSSLIYCLMQQKRQNSNVHATRGDFSTWRTTAAGVRPLSTGAPSDRWQKKDIPLWYFNILITVLNV